MNTMTYKGYLGSVAYSEKDQVFFGKIEGINGLVNFEGESVKKLTEAQVKKTFPGATIIKLDRDRRGYDVKLNNGMDLEFNKKFEIVEVDD